MAAPLRPPNLLAEGEKMELMTYIAKNKPIEFAQHANRFLRALDLDMRFWRYLSSEEDMEMEKMLRESRAPENEAESNDFLAQEGEAENNPNGFQGQEGEAENNPNDFQGQEGEAENNEADDADDEHELEPAFRFTEYECPPLDTDLSMLAEEIWGNRNGDVGRKQQVGEAENFKGTRTDGPEDESEAAIDNENYNKMSPEVKEDQVQSIEQESAELEVDLVKVQVESPDGGTDQMVTKAEDSTADTDSDDSLPALKILLPPAKTLKRPRAESPTGRQRHSVSKHSNHRNKKLKTTGAAKR